MGSRPCDLCAGNTDRRATMASPFVPPMEMPPIARPIRTSFAIKKKKRTMAGTPKVSVSEPKQSHMPLRDAALPMVSLAVACPPMSPGHAGPYDLEVFETGAVSLPMRKSFLNAGALSLNSPSAAAKRCSAR